MMMMIKTMMIKTKMIKTMMIKTMMIKTMMTMTMMIMGMMMMTWIYRHHDPSRGGVLTHVPEDLALQARDSLQTRSSLLINESLCFYLVCQGEV